MGNTNAGWSKQESPSLFFKVSYVELKVASNLLIVIRPESPDRGLFTLTRKTLSSFHAYQRTAGFPLLYHTTTFPVWLSALFGVLWACYYMQFSLMPMIDLATVVCERCTSPEVLYNCRITLISSILMFSNFFALGSCLRHSIRYPWRFPNCFVEIL